MTQDNLTETTPVPEEVSAFAARNARDLVELNLKAALERPSKSPNAGEVQSYIQAVAKPLKNSVMLITQAGESLLLFHSEQERKTAFDALNKLPSLLRRADHIVYNHKEPRTAMVDGKVYALKIGAALATELAGITQQGSIHLPIKEIANQDDLVSAYREFARQFTPQSGVIR